MNTKNKIDFGGGWSPSETILVNKQINKIHFADKLRSAIENKDYDIFQQLIKDPQFQKSKVQKLATDALVSHFDIRTYSIAQKALELGISHIFHAIEENPNLLLDDAIVDLIESEKTKKNNAWFCDRNTSIYSGVYEEFLEKYINADYSVLPILQKIQSIDPSVFESISDLSFTVLAPMSSATQNLLLSFPVQSWRQTVEAMDTRAPAVTSEELQKTYKALEFFPALYSNFQNFYSTKSQSHHKFIEIFENNIGYTSKDCALLQKMKNKNVHIVGEWETFKTVKSLCTTLLPYNNKITQLGLSDPQSLLYNFNDYRDVCTWVENGQEQSVVLHPQPPNYLSHLLCGGAPALELALQTQQGRDAVEDCLKDNCVRAMFAMKAPLATIKTALSAIPSLKDMKDGFGNSMDHFMALRTDQNKQVVECVAQHFSNEENAFGKTFGNVYAYIQSPTRSSEYQKLLLKGAVKKDTGVFKKMRSTSKPKRKM